jgi:hypothetical protein
LKQTIQEGLHKSNKIILEKAGKLHGYEFKFSSKSPKMPKAWGDTYSEASYAVVNRDNYLDWIAGARFEK